MAIDNYEQLIIEGIKGLPSVTLAEIADFIYFVRKRALQPESFAEDLSSIMLGLEGREMSYAEQQHLEQEFADYEQQYPHE